MTKKYAAFLVVIFSFAFVLNSCIFYRKVFTYEYKQITYDREDIYGKKIIFTVPKSWSCTELLSDERIISFTENGVEIAYASIDKKTRDGAINFFENRDALIKDKEDKIKVINSNCFILDTVSNDTIYFIDGSDILTVHLDAAAEIGTAETIAVYLKTDAVSTAETTGTDVIKEVETTKELDFIPDISFLDDKMSLYRKKTYNEVYSVFLKINGLSDIMDKIEDICYLGQSCRFYYITFNVNDGYNYYIIEDYVTRNLVLAKSIEKSINANMYNYNIIVQKPLPSNVTLVNTHHSKMMNSGSNASFITINDIERIIQTANMDVIFKQSTKLHATETVYDNNIWIQFRFYVPELKAYFQAIEVYTDRSANFGIVGINNETEHIDRKYWKYNVYKPLAPEADINNYKGAS